MTAHSPDPTPVVAAPVPAQWPGAPGDWRSRVVGHSLSGAAGQALEWGQALIAAASRLVMRSGGAEFTMQNVAVEAGVSLRVLYRHFAGRDDLLVALLEESSLVLSRLVREDVERFTDPLERLGAALFFATDARQHTDRSYNTAMARLVAGAAVNAPEAIGRARRPVVDVFAELIRAAMAAGRIDRGDPEERAVTVAATYFTLQEGTYLGSSIGGAVPGQDWFIRFCLRGLGATVPTGWEARFHLDDAAVAAGRRRTAEASAAIRRHPPSDGTASRAASSSGPTT